jgi:putative ABC transport system permease protein
MLSIGIICVGVIAVLVAWGFVSATYWGLREVTIATGIGHIQIGNKGTFNDAVYIEDKGMPGVIVEKIMKYCAAKEHVRFAMKRIGFEGLITFNNKTLTFVGTGIEPGKEIRLSGVYAPLVSGTGLSIIGDENRYQVLVAEGLANSLACNVGDSISVLVNMIDGGLNAIDLEVRGIYKTGFPEVDKRNILISIETAQELLYTENIDRLVISLDKTISTNEIAEDIAAHFPEIEVRPWSFLAVYYKQVVTLYSTLFSIFGIVILVVAFLAIANTMFMSIMERIREIGTLFALGIKRYFISLIFLMEGIIIGVFGSLIGIMITSLLSVVIRALEIKMPPPPGRTLEYSLSIFMDIKSMLLITIIIIVISSIASLVPILKYSKLSIVKALNHV